MKNEKVRITPAQYEILDHRLTIPDCICEVFNDTEGVAPCTEEEVEASVKKIDEMAKAGEIDLALLSDFDKDVLEDVLDGSVFLYLAEDAAYREISPQKYRGYLRAADNLEEKLERVWKRIKIPR